MCEIDLLLPHPTPPHSTTADSQRSTSFTLSQKVWSISWMGSLLRMRCQASWVDLSDWLMVHGYFTRRPEGKCPDIVWISIKPTYMCINVRVKVSGGDQFFCYISSKKAHFDAVTASYSIIRRLSFSHCLCFSWKMYPSGIHHPVALQKTSTQRDPGDPKSLTHSIFSFMWRQRCGTDAGFSRFTHMHEKNQSKKKKTVAKHLHVCKKQSFRCQEPNQAPHCHLWATSLTPWAPASASQRRRAGSPSPTSFFLSPTPSVRELSSHTALPIEGRSVVALIDTNDKTFLTFQLCFCYTDIVITHLFKIDMSRIDSCKRVSVYSFPVRYQPKCDWFDF